MRTFGVLLLSTALVGCDMGRMETDSYAARELVGNGERVYFTGRNEVCDS